MSDKNFKVKNGADIGGTVTATAFAGDGSALTGISSSYSAPTLGSTSIASGATVTTISGLTDIVLNGPGSVADELTLLLMGAL